MTTGKALNGKPYAGNPHVRFDEGEVASAATPRRGSLLYTLAAVAASAALPLAVDAASISIDGVRQQLPWSSNVDVTYTVTDGDGCFDTRVGRVLIKSVVNGVEYVAYDGISSPGRHTVAWTNPPQGVKCDDCKMSAELYISDPVPSGDDYMVVDLVTGAVTYEGLFVPNEKFASFTGQQLSNARYNTDKYKTTHMVLRKIPKGTYKAKRGTGAFKSWTTDKDFYIGIFCWTTAQYGHVIKRTNGQDATPWSDYSLKSRRWRPCDIRGNTVPSGKVATYPGADAAIDAKKWRPLELLNAKTGMNFDVPTELMHEIACRAGTTTTFFWGNDASLAPQYAVYGISGRNTDSQYADPPGTRKPNAWGLYDMVGNDWQWCRTYVGESEPPDVFTPGKGSSDRWYVRGENIYPTDPTRLSSDVRSSAFTSSGVGYSFRAAYVVPNAGK
ncbi:MAG: SUMF1/EgtB/PvdO family nonheme iron enzyme [Kiritimatiellae bacterium]|nr:SUMF1/EgtB/PvdO family nonheme iron enzyme [Kiritimatiellia bacterium]